MPDMMFDALEATTARTPDKTALVCEGATMTFAELDARANQVASFLRDRGVVKGDRVGIALPKSNTYVCLLFGILKAGAAYVPIDPSFPAERVGQILEDCGIGVAFAAGPVIDEMPASRRPKTLRTLVLVEGETKDVEALSMKDVDAQPKTFERRPSVVDGDLAYVMYTSGSTGKPKGVMVTHGNLNAFMAWCRRTLKITADDVVVQLAPFTFDISGLDTYGALTAGATLHIVRDQTMINTVLAAIEKGKVTIISTVPTVIGAIVNRPQLFKRYDLSSIRMFITGAAACPGVFAKKLAEHLPNARLYNLYGPTEATIYCMMHPIDPATLEVDRIVPIGKPYDNMESYVLKDDGTLAAPGEVGELVLRGPQVSPGYFGNAEKTQAAFRNFPLLPHLNEKVYFTGDEAKMDEAGVFHFLGRKDDMIKSRGYRIELNEIDLALASLDHALDEFCAVAVPDVDIENKIVAAIVKKAGAEVAIDQVKARCTERLPHYMVPDEIVFFETLPKTSSGKVSRKDIVKLLKDRPATA